MKTYGTKSVCVVLLMHLGGCWIGPHRPPNVPTSATWVDHTFIDCSVETQSKANRCTVYKDDTGEILANGLFVLNTSKSAAESSELRYAAFGGRIIYLESARTLVPWWPSERDPTNRIMIERLRSLAGRGGKQATECRNTAHGARRILKTECALEAFKEKKPFYVRFANQGVDYEVWSNGFAGDADGNVWELDFDSKGLSQSSLPKAAELHDDNRIVVIPCPKPIALTLNVLGALTCSRDHHELGTVPWRVSQ